MLLSVAFSVASAVKCLKLCKVNLLLLKPLALNLSLTICDKVSLHNLLSDTFNVLCDVLVNNASLGLYAFLTFK